MRGYVPCYLTVKKKEILPFAMVWMDLEGVIPNDTSQTERDRDCGFSLMRGSKKAELQERERARWFPAPGAGQMWEGGPRAQTSSSGRIRCGDLMHTVGTLMNNAYYTLESY